MSSQKPVVLIGISGCSSSGKTTVAKLIATLAQDTVLIHQDDFYKHDEDIPVNEKYQIQDWDCIESLDIPLFRKELTQIKETGSISTNLIHMDNVDDISKFNLDKELIERLRTMFKEITDRVRLILVDGFMLYNDDITRSKFDLKILIRAPYEQLKKRRNDRNGYQTLDSFWVDPPYYFDEFVYKSYASSHGKFFLNNDVEGVIDQEKASDIKDFMNCDDTPISVTLDWVTRQIYNYCL